MNLNADLNSKTQWNLECYALKKLLFYQSKTTSTSSYSMHLSNLIVLVVVLIMVTSKNTG